MNRQSRGLKSRERRRKRIRFTFPVRFAGPHGFSAVSLEGKRLGQFIAQFSRGVSDVFEAPPTLVVSSVLDLNFINDHTGRINVREKIFGNFDGFHFYFSLVDLVRGRVAFSALG